MGYKAGQTKSDGVFKATAGGIKGQKIGSGTIYKPSTKVPAGGKPKGGKKGGY